MLESLTERLIAVYLGGFILSCQIAIHFKREGEWHDDRAKVMLRVLAWPYWLVASLIRIGK